MRPVITLFNPSGIPIATRTAGGSGKDAVINSVSVSVAGTYTAKVTGSSSTTGSYSLRVLLDAAVESESHDGAGNGTIPTAQDIESSFITVGSGAVATVLGTTDFGPLPSEFEPNDTTATANPASGNFAAFVGDRFQLRISGTVSSVADADYFNIGTLQSGDVITLTNSGSDSSRGTLSDAILELYRSNGGSPVLVTKDDDSGPGEDSLIDHFTVTDLDTYFVLATNFSTETGTYQLGIFLENSGAAPSTVGSLITETEGNNSFATANNASTSWRAVNLLAQTAGSITASDVDVYQYLFNAGDLVTVDIDSTSSLDARVSLLNAGGVVLAVEDGTSNRLGLGDLDSSLYAFRIPSSGTYFVQVEANSGTGSYAADVYLSGLTAPAVSVLDLYAFSLTAGQSVSLVVEGLTAGNVDLALLDSAGVTVATGSVGASNVDESISNFVSVTGGTYYAQVTGGNRVDYSLVVVRDAGFDLEANNSFATAQVLNSNVLGHVVGQDWYQFSAGIGDTITLATATPGDGANEFVNNLNPFIELFDPNVVSLASDDDSGPSSNSLLTFIATSTGMHRVRLTGFGGSTGEYFLSASITNNPSPTVSIAANDATAAEPSDGGQFTISLTNPSSTATTVFFTVTGSASATDYTSLGTSVVIPAFATSVTLNMALLADTLVEGDETVIVTLTSVSGDSQIFLDSDAADRTAMVTISDTEDTATVSIMANDATATEPSDNGQFTISLTNPSNTPTTVFFTVTGTASGTDYTSLGTSVVIPANATSVTLGVTLLADIDVEGDETVIVTLTGVSGDPQISLDSIAANLAATVTIFDNDFEVTVAVSPGSVTEDFGSDLVYTFTRTGSLTNPLTVQFSVGGVAVFATDYSQSGAASFNALSGSVVIPAFASTATVTIDPTSDLTVETNETVVLTVSANSAYRVGSPSVANGTITDNDSAVFSIADASAAEGAGVTFTVTLSAAVDVPTSVTVTTANGTATTADSDYTAVTSQVVSFAAGQTSRTITINTTADNKVEANETFTATLGGLNDGGLSVTISGASTATGTITNNDAAVFSIANSSALEGSGVIFTITLSNPVDVTTSVTFTTSDGTATLSNSDYTAVSSQTVIFSAGQTTQTITVNTTADTTVEVDETFTATLAGLMDGGRAVSISSSNGVATGTILNDESASFSITGASGVEGAGVTFTVTLSAAVDVATSVTVTTANGTATTADSDYTGVTSQVVSFLAGQLSQTITITTTADNKVEADETFTVTLGGLVNGGLYSVTISGASTAIGTITNDDAAEFSTVNASAAEGGVITFNVTLSSPVDVATSVILSTSDGTATLSNSDYTAVSQTVNFAAGQTTQNVTVNTTADTTVEVDETFTATLAVLMDGGRSVTISGTAGSATGTITNNDSAVFSIANVSAIEGNGMTFTITLSNAVDVATSVTVTTANVTATTADSDYTGVTSQVVSFLAGQTSRTITITTTADNKVEANETFTATLGGLNDGGRNVTLSSTNGAAIGTITNDDAAVFSIANSTAFEGFGLVFTVTLSNPVDVATSVTVSTTDGTAMATAATDSDYSALVTRLVSFAAGVILQTVTVNTNLDLKVEGDETLTATLGNLSNGGRDVSLSVPNRTATGTIFNNNTEVSVSVSPGSVVEDGLVPLVYTFTRIGVVAGTLTTNFTVGGSAAALSDYSQLGAASFTAPTGTVVFASGNFTATVTITPTVDSNTEFDETVVLNVAAGAGYAIGTTNSATGTIRDDDAQISLSVSPSNVAEDGATNLAYTFNRVGSTSGAQVVNFNVGGTAMFGSDYSTANATSFTATTGSITFAPGASSVTMFVDPAADNAIESDESVSITLATGSGYLTPSLVPVIGTIDNDDFDVSMALTPDSLAEDAPGTFAYTFSRTGGLNRPLSVQVGIGGTALAGFDYSQTGAAPFSASGGIVTFASGASTATLRIDPIVDTGIEADETVEVTLLPGSGYTATGTAFYRGTITNDDQLVSLSSATASVTEDGAENLVVIFTRTGATAGALSIPMTLGGTATFNTDYVATGNATFSAGASQLLFAAGVTTATLTFDPAIEAELESSEVLLLTLAKNALLGVPATIVAAGTILNDDATVSVSVTPDRVPEEGAGNLVYTFQRFGDTSQAATVNFSVSGLATFGVDYLQTGAASFTSTSGTIVIPAGRSDATLTLDPTPDGLNEANETAILTILPSLGFTPSGDPALGTIINQVTNIALSVTPTQLPENSTSNLLYKFTRTGNLIGELTVQFAVSGSATFAADYLQSGASSFSATEGSITFADGATTATLTIDPQSDSIDELTETVVVTILPDTELYNITGAGTATTSITDTSMISLAVSPSSVNENGVPNLLFNFSRSGSTQQALTVNFSVAGSASFGTDYSQTGAATFSASVGTVTFAAGSSTKTVTVNPTADFTIEADETVILTVVSGTSYLIAGDYTATGIIANDDVNIGNVITLDSLGRLHITDTVGRDDRLKVTKNAANELVITDSANPLTTTVGRQVTAQEVRVPLASITSKVLIVELNGGADHIDLSGIPTRTVSGVVVNLLDVTVSGGAGDDTIIGSAGSDTLLGGDGNDSIDGGSGNDGISGDAGNDKLNGNSGNDSIMGGTGNDYMLGGAGNDRMVGQSGEDTVIGQGGIDRIAGGSGFGRDVGDVVTDNFAEIDEAFRISFNGTKFLLI